MHGRLACRHAVHAGFSPPRSLPAPLSCSPHSSHPRRPQPTNHAAKLPTARHNPFTLSWLSPHIHTTTHPVHQPPLPPTPEPCRLQLRCAPTACSPVRLLSRRGRTQTATPRRPASELPHRRMHPRRWAAPAAAPRGHPALAVLPPTCACACLQGWVEVRVGGRRQECKS